MVHLFDDFPLTKAIPKWWALEFGGHIPLAGSSFPYASTSLTHLSWITRDFVLYDQESNQEFHVSTAVMRTRFIGTAEKSWSRSGSSWVDWMWNQDFFSMTARPWHRNPWHVCCFGLCWMPGAQPSGRKLQVENGRWGDRCSYCCQMFTERNFGSNVKWTLEDSTKRNFWQVQFWKVHRM